MFRFPFVAVSIALAINRESVVGVVFNPILNEVSRYIDRARYQNNNVRPVVLCGKGSRSVFERDVPAAVAAGCSHLWIL
jgi:fructose-1,6-bisphosphatase/inositol monophosphatase family enzyme